MKKLCYILILALCLTLGGCSLLREDEGNEPSAGVRLVGVYITSEYIDTFDLEGYISEGMGAQSGGEVSAADAARYSGRVYAEVADGEAVFPIEGVAVISARFGEGHERYIGSQRGVYVYGGSTHVSSADGMESIELSASISVPAGEAVSVFCNPVYQQTDGSIYLIRGQGISSDGAGSMSQTISESTDPYGGEPGYGMSIELSVIPRRLSDKYVLLRYGGDGALLGREEYAPGELPGEIPSSGAAFAVIEDHCRDENGEAAVERTLLTPGSGEEFLSFTREDGSPWLRPRSTVLK